MKLFVIILNKMDNPTTDVLLRLMKLNNIKNASQLATRINGNRGTLGRVLRGEQPSEKTLNTLANFFKVPKDYLATGNKMYLEDDTIKENNPDSGLIDKTNKKLSDKELLKFLEILLYNKEDYKHSKIYQNFEESIRIDERIKLKENSNN